MLLSIYFGASCVNLIFVVKIAIVKKYDTLALCTVNINVKHPEENVVLTQFFLQLADMV